MTDTALAPAFEIRPPGFWRGLLHIAALELRQRLRSRTLLVLAIVWFCLIGVVTGAMWLWLSAMSGAYGQGFDSYPSSRSSSTSCCCSAPWWRRRSPPAPSARNARAGRSRPPR
ncbi:hypothetical protein AB3K78_09880 [Leucobacter sp. HNU]|uniref:hypothetical protein n=1 Tax=Leucobacter sp. HNU TaxID=3236805 RepID=UPI003A7FC824